MNVLVIDPSTRVCGYALFRASTLSLWGEIKKNDKIPTERFKGFYCDILELVKKYEVDLLVFEDTNRLLNVKTLKSLCYMQGILMAVAFESKIPFNQVLPNEWRKIMEFSTGKRAGQKREVQKQIALDYCNLILGLEVASEDIADAICLGVAWHKHNITT